MADKIPRCARNDNQTNTGPQAPNTQHSTRLRPMAETIPVGADHAGYAMKERVVTELRRLGYTPLDLGPGSEASVDYPDYAHSVAGMIERGDAQRGVLLCGTGLGMACAANRHPGVRAAVVWSDEIARLSREHNNANILVLPARFIPESDALGILRIWLETTFAGGRHSRRIEKIDNITEPVQ